MRSDFSRALGSDFAVGVEGTGGAMRFMLIDCGTDGGRGALQARRIHYRVHQARHALLVMSLEFVV